MLYVLKNYNLNYSIVSKVPLHFRSLCSLLQKKNNRPLVDISVEEGPLRSVYPAIREEIIEEHLVLKGNSELRDRCEKLLDYNANVETPFLSASLIFLHTYKLLEKPSLLNHENLKKAYILAWCHKLIHSSININDDIIDRSNIRYNKTTWYQLPDVGKDAAIVDAAFLLNGAIFLLQNHLRCLPHQYIMQKHFLRAHAIMNLSNIPELKKIKINEGDKHQLDIKFYSYNIISTAMFLANVTDGYLHEVCEEICNDLSRFIRIEDDVVDLYDSEGNIRKTSCTDISLGRPSWLTMEAYKKGSAAQKKILEENFGKNNEESTEKIYSIFEDLQLLDVYKKLSDEFYEQAIYKIQKKLPKSKMQDALLDLLTLIVNHKCM
uniref:Terpene synthase n=1 Tax=Phyllotreta striolata TaxID=444603 RepID=A0A140AZ69_PHYSR|nr:terpene synthase [Phyllotreta striolata]